MRTERSPHATRRRPRPPTAMTARRRVTPTFRALDRGECEAVLARNTVGRLAFTFHDQVDVEPLHYAFDGEWLYCRTAPGAKTAVLAHHPWVALEVDEVRAPLDWTSVVAHGTVYRLQARGAIADRASYQRALDALRRAFPATLTADDPVGFRSVILGVHVNSVTGRAATV